MSSFTVSAVVDGDTFEVSPSWQWQGQVGRRVRPTGYDTPELAGRGGAAARHKLDALIRGNSVELGTAYRVDRGRLVCDVFFGGRKLADYFPEYR